MLVNHPGCRNVSLKCTHSRNSFSGYFFLPAAGNRNRSSGASNNQGSNGNYWSSSPSGANASNVNFNSATLNTNTNNRANGYSVRCVQAFTGRLLYLYN
ncbi:MAG: hypothetical protein EGQ00_00040 [Parabacteroides johnsonii]|nr:hypothetical protein [Parabacteroides johnsonii]